MFKYSSGMPSLALLGSFLPRRCGIATFSHDLYHAIKQSLPEKASCMVLAMNDIPQGYAYDDMVRFEINASRREDYGHAADFLHINQVETLIVQHEYGIFGGSAGDYLLHLLRNLRIPIITTLHTVLTEPDEEQHLVLNELLALSDRVIVMSQKAIDILTTRYDVEPQNIVKIPHGIPEFSFHLEPKSKSILDLDGKRIILNFGLLSPGKGVEYLIESLPKVIEKYPDTMTVILGATHPHVRRDSGESYRRSLQQKVAELGLSNHVQFQNKFVGIRELTSYLDACDIYVSPYLNETQITSGTLAYALGAGKAVIATPYWYATEMLANDRGRLVPFRDSKVLGETVIDLFDNPDKCLRMRKKAYAYCQDMVWRAVGKRYLNTISKVISQSRRNPKALISRQRIQQKWEELPDIKTDHLLSLTDDTGILQHALFDIPNRSHGYCLDDNARGLIASLLYWKIKRDDALFPLMRTYFSFIHDAYNDQTSSFRNFMAYNRTWLEESGSDDAQGRAISALGLMVARAPYESLRQLSASLFHKAVPNLLQLTSPRAWAHGLIGIGQYLSQFSGDIQMRQLQKQLSDKLLALFSSATPDWPWCEETITYSNAIIPHSLILTGRKSGETRLVQQGMTLLKWLIEIQKAARGHLSPIGNDGWYAKNGQKAAFDQQPIEAMGLTLACGEAYWATRELFWITQAKWCLSWFMGYNDVNTPLCNFKTGGCHDGITIHGINENQGAESTLSWLIALLTAHDLEKQLSAHKHAPQHTQPTQELQPT